MGQDRHGRGQDGRRDQYLASLTERPRRPGTWRRLPSSTSVDCRPVRLESGLIAENWQIIDLAGLQKQVDAIAEERSTSLPGGSRR
jgi:hypothetical protein